MVSKHTCVVACQTYKCRWQPSIAGLIEAAQSCSQKSCCLDDCRTQLLSKCGEKSESDAAATGAGEQDSVAPLPSVHKGAITELDAWQKSARAAAYEDRVRSHLTIMRRSAPVWFPVMQHSDMAALALSRCLLGFIYLCR